MSNSIRWVLGLALCVFMYYVSQTSPSGELKSLLQETKQHVTFLNETVRYKAHRDRPVPQGSGNNGPVVRQPLDPSVPAKELMERTKKLYGELKAKEQTEDVKEMLKACNSLNKLLSAIVQLESQASTGGELQQYNQWVAAANRQIKELDLALARLRH